MISASNFVIVPQFQCQIMGIIIIWWLGWTWGSKMLPIEISSPDSYCVENRSREFHLKPSEVVFLTFFAITADRKSVQNLVILRQTVLEIFEVRFCVDRTWPRPISWGLKRMRTKIRGYHHNGNQAARRPHILRSIYHSFGALAKAVRLLTASLHSQPMCS